MKSLPERLARAERKIAEVIEESRRPHTEAEYMGILMWARDGIAEREAILKQILLDSAASNWKGGKTVRSHW